MAILFSLLLVFGKLEKISLLIQWIIAHFFFKKPFDFLLYYVKRTHSAKLQSDVI